MCRWHVATAVAFPQKRNPTFSAKIKPSVRAAFSFNEQDALAVLCLSRAAAFSSLLAICRGGICSRNMIQ